LKLTASNISNLIAMKQSESRHKVRLAEVVSLLSKVSLLFSVSLVLSVSLILSVSLFDGITGIGL
jgi:hypothetical protein